ncbi:MAG: lipid-A-disaccharide synthase [Methylobacteriaceae bacterium]|nr:lipid-A-disaccharide synthase [Methylobacteriaceae bacterium]MBV9222140.1 lipid-A-disaccharide synthase [Methylobacteriaceae bacterium]MBV9244812.1 lipid-A-disaccharide synthase [Methylobacteriaceae bacterium]MBV9636132.1 lipid-A-disaccharide synthase [Methylobacteriaceae bacterium]MBV9703098.1 lipid-A-disaccharide synthase [Methylobacteriaceae bacterium]
MTDSVEPKPLDVFIVVGEHSGDQLGAKLMGALRHATGGAVAFRGVGGEAMARAGLQSLFPLADIAVMGISAVLARLPLLRRRILETVEAIVAARPGVLVIIDCPGFTHRVAKRVRRRLPWLPVVDYVSPSVWAWGSWRARVMRAYVDQVLALLPFEPAAQARLGGPATTYVGHPLVEALAELRPGPAESQRRDEVPPLVLVLPGSRRAEITRLLPVFEAAVARVAAALASVEFVLPAVSHLEPEIRAAVATWRVKPRIVVGPSAKLEAFRAARAALAASGTVTLELALAGVPMVVGYRFSKLDEQLKYIVKVPSIVLPNLILGRNAIPELLQTNCTPERLADALVPLIRGGPERDAQLAALRKVNELMRLPTGQTPSELAAAIVVETAEGRRVDAPRVR